MHAATATLWHSLRDDKDEKEPDERVVTDVVEALKNMLGTHQRSSVRELTREKFDEPIEYRLPERDRCCRKGQQRGISSHLPINRPAFAERSKLAHNALVGRTASLPWFWFSIRVDNVQIYRIGRSFQSIDQALRTCPAGSLIVSFETVAHVHFAVQLVWRPDGFVQSAAGHAIWAE